MIVQTVSFYKSGVDDNVSDGLENKPFEKESAIITAVRIAIAGFVFFGRRFHCI